MWLIWCSARNLWKKNWNNIQIGNLNAEIQTFQVACSKRACFKRACSIRACSIRACSIRAYSKIVCSRGVLYSNERAPMSVLQWACLERACSKRVCSLKGAYVNEHGPKECCTPMSVLQKSVLQKSIFPRVWPLKRLCFKEFTQMSFRKSMIHWICSKKYALKECCTSVSVLRKSLLQGMYSNECASKECCTSVRSLKERALKERALKERALACFKERASRSVLQLTCSRKSMLQGAYL